MKCHGVYSHHGKDLGRCMTTTIVNRIRQLISTHKNLPSTYQKRQFGNYALKFRNPQSNSFVVFTLLFQPIWWWNNLRNRVQKKGQDDYMLGNDNITNISRLSYFLVFAHRICGCQSYLRPAACPCELPCWTICPSAPTIFDWAPRAPSSHSACTCSVVLFPSCAGHRAHPRKPPVTATYLTCSPWSCCSTSSQLRVWLCGRGYPSTGGRCAVSLLMKRSSPPVMKSAPIYVSHSTQSHINRVFSSAQVFTACSDILYGWCCLFWIADFQSEFQRDGSEGTTSLGRAQIVPQYNSHNTQQEGALSTCSCPSYRISSACFLTLFSIWNSYWRLLRKCLARITFRVGFFAVTSHLRRLFLKETEKCAEGLVRPPQSILGEVRQKATLSFLAKWLAPMGLYWPFLTQPFFHRIGYRMHWCSWPQAKNTTVPST